MSRAFAIHVPPEGAFRRRGSFALELLDPVTLERIAAGMDVVADGLSGVPSVNSSGLFVWLEQDVSRLRKVSIDPKTLPYDTLELEPAQLNLPGAPSPVTTIELPLRTDYPFSAGITAARCTLIEERVVPPAVPVPVSGALVHLQWLDDNGITWRDLSPVSRTSSRGDFVVVLRILPTQLPQVDVNGAVTVRLVARRGSSARTSADFKLLQGRVTDPTTLNTLVFAWDELQP
jgi:hypothetical protein